jgi:isoquinoline 1-oxidoreductase alpha subunit
MRALALIAANPNPPTKTSTPAMKDNVCRCGTYVRIRAAIKRAAAVMSAGRLTRRAPTDRRAYRRRA